MKNILKNISKYVIYNKKEKVLEKRLKIKTIKLVQKVGSQGICMYPCVIYDENYLILFDTGSPNQINQIEKELNKIGFSIENITHVVISHQDHDHIGSLKQLKLINQNIIVIASDIEAPYIDGTKESLRLIQAKEYNKNLKDEALVFGMNFVKYLQTIENCVVDRVVKDNDYIIPKLKVISTKGHTPGHISLFNEEDNTLISGDSIAFENDEFVIANPEFTFDLENCLKSIKKIINLNPKRVICYHGGECNNNILFLLNKLV